MIQVLRLKERNSRSRAQAFHGVQLMRTEAKVITIGELAEYLRVHRSTLYRLLRKGQLPGFKIGSDWRFNVEAIDRWRMQQGTETLDDTSKAESPIIQ